MKKIKSLISLLLIITSCYMVVSCKMKSHTSFGYLIQIDSMHVPQIMNSKTAFEIDLFGIVGPNKCYSFGTFNQVMTTNNDIFVEAWGHYESDSNLCPDGIVYLTGHVDMIISSPGTYNLKIKQPDNSYLEKQIIVN